MSAIMSDSLPTICADQLTKAVNLAAAGTFTALDGENDDEEHFKGNCEKEHPTKELPTLKLLEALSSSVTPNLSRLTELESENTSMTSLPRTTKDVNNKTRQKSSPTISAAPPPPAVKKYSNRKNYKLLPPVIPSQLGAGVKKIKPSIFHQKQQLLTLGPRLKSVSPNELTGLRLRPLSVTGSGVMVIRPPQSHSPPQTLKSSGKAPYVSPVIIERDTRLQNSTSQQLFIQNKAPLKVSLPMDLICSTANSEPKAVSVSHMPIYPLSNFQTAGVLQPTIRSPKYLQASTANQNITQATTCFSKREQYSMGVTHLARSAPGKTIATSTVSSGNNFSMSTCIIQANKNISVPSSIKDLNLNASIPLKTTDNSSKGLTPIASKSVYVPILPQPAKFDATGSAGQLIFQNSCLQMIHSNGSLQTIAFVHPPINSKPPALSNSDMPPISYSQPVENSITVDNSQHFMNNTSFHTTSVMPSSIKTASPVILCSTSNPVSCDSVIISKLSDSLINSCVNNSDCIPTISTAKNTHKTMLATVIAGPPRLNTVQNCQPVPSTASASPPRSALQYLARLLVPKSKSECEETPSLTAQKNQKKQVCENEVGIKQPISDNFMARLNFNKADKMNRCHSLLSKSSRFDLASENAHLPSCLTASNVSNSNANSSTSVGFSKKVLSPSLLSNHDQLSPTTQSSLSDNPVSQASSLPSHILSSDQEFISDTESDNASATAVAAAAMMSLAQTTDPLPRSNTTGINLATKDIDAHSSAESSNNIPIPHKVSFNDSLFLTNQSNVSTLLSLKPSETPMIDLNVDCNSRKAPFTDSMLPKTSIAQFQPCSAKNFTGKFFVRSKCGKKMVVSPSGIKHLQSILRQRGISEGYFVITSPRVPNTSSVPTYETSLSPQEDVESHTPKDDSNEPRAAALHERQKATHFSPKEREWSVASVGQGGNNSKSWPSADTVQSGTKQDFRSEDLEYGDNDNSSCTSRSSSAALVIETGEEDGQDIPHQSPRSNKEMSILTENRDNIPDVTRTKITEVLSSSDALDKFHDNPCIPQSPLSLSDLVRQQANRVGLLNYKDPDYSYFKSPGSATKETFDSIRESNSFALPTPINHTSASTNEQLRQSPSEAIIDNDMGPEYRRSVFTPGSLLPVDLSYERDSQLAGTGRTEPVSNLPHSPPKVAVSSISVPSPRSPFMVSGGTADQTTSLNPPMTPNTMLINLLNRVPTPLLTSNQDLLTLPTSQDSRTFEIGPALKTKNSVPEKRGDSVYPEKPCTFNDSQEFADSLTANTFFSDSRKSTNNDHRSFEPPQNALEMIASNYTVSSIANENTPDTVNQINFPGEENFERSAYTGNDHSLQEEFDANFHCSPSCKKACHDSMQCCDHLLVTVNLDSDTPAYAVPVPHSHEECMRSKHTFQAGKNVICSHYHTENTDNLHCIFNNAANDRVQAPQPAGKSADTNILRHLIMSTNTSYHSQPVMSNHPHDISDGNFHIINQQQEQCQQQHLPHLLCRVDNLFSNQGKSLQSRLTQAEQSSGFSEHRDSQFPHTVQTSSQIPCSYSDSSISFKKATFHCAISSSQISESLNLHSNESGLGGLQNLPYVGENISKPSMSVSHDFESSERHLQHFHPDTHESDVYFDHNHQQTSLQPLRQDSEQHFHSSDRQGINSYDREQNMENYGQNNQETNIATAYDQSHQIYGQAGQDSLQAFDQNNPQSNIQVFNQSERQKSLEDFDQIEHGRNLHSFPSAKHSSNIQPYEQHPDPHGINYNIESLQPPPDTPSDHMYSSSSMPNQDSSRMFVPHPDQVSYMGDQQYPSAPSTFFTSSPNGDVGSTMPSLFPEQCAIGSEAPIIGNSNNHHIHHCSGSFRNTSQGLQQPQQYPYPGNHSSNERVSLSGSHHQQDPEVEDSSGSLEKQPVLPSASFSPPSVADQAANQAAAAAEGGEVGHQYSGAFPNLSIYDLYLRGSNAEARGGASEAETLSGNFCVECNTMYKTQCKFHSCDYTYVTDTPILSHARLTLPSCLTLGESSVMGHTNNTGVFAKEKVAVRTKFGPLTGSPVSCDKLGSTRSFSLWQTFMGGSVKVVDSSDENSSNWLMFVKPARVSMEQNLVAFQHGHSVYFVTRQEIQPHQELLYWFAKDYARILGIADKSKSGQHMLCPHCSICKHIFPDRKELRSHLRLQHPRPCNKQCNQCSKRFSQVSHLKAHIASVHSQVKKFVCPQCGKRFSDGSNFKKHIKLHTKEKPFKCQLCGRDFQQKSHLKSHMNTHMPVKNEQCGFCGKRFTRAFTRRQHELQHTKQNKIQCEHCGKVFYKQKIYKHHLKIHRDERNYPCLQCHRSFRTRGNLLRHGPACKRKKCLDLSSCPSVNPSHHPPPLQPMAPPPPPHLPAFPTSSVGDSTTSCSTLLPILSQNHCQRSSLQELPDSGTSSSLPSALNSSPNVSESHLSLGSASLNQQADRQQH